MKGKVLLITHDIYQDDNYFPLGYSYMAAMLKKAGYEVEICSHDVFHYSNEEMAQKYLEKNDYDLIGVGFVAARFKETILGLCETINKYKKNAWLVLGGPGPSPIPEYMLKKTGADIVAVGEGEETIVELLKCKLEKGDLSVIKGIAYRKGEDVAVNERRRPIFLLDSIPFPEWSLFPVEKYIDGLRPFKASKEDRAFIILTSRGCVNRCNFCYRMEAGIRFRSIGNVIEEIKILQKKYGINYFLMYDELFVFTKKRALEFSEAIKKNNLKIKFACNARVDIFDSEVVRHLKEAGCQFVNFGMESSSQKVLDLMHKNTLVEENISAAEITNKEGVGLGLNFLWGNIGDTKESLENNVKLIKKYNLYDQIRTIRPVTPYPGCDLYYEAIKKGLLSGPEDFFNKFKNSDLLTVNFTSIPDDEFYGLLFNANKELIMDHYLNTDNDLVAAEKLIQSFYNLYIKKDYKFRGARHYVKNK